MYVYDIQIKIYSINQQNILIMLFLYAIYTLEKNDKLLSMQHIRPIDYQ